MKTILQSTRGLRGLTSQAGGSGHRKTSARQKIFPQLFFGSSSWATRGDEMASASIRTPSSKLRSRVDSHSHCHGRRQGSATEQICNGASSIADERLLQLLACVANTAKGVARPSIGNDGARTSLSSRVLVRGGPIRHSCRMVPFDIPFDISIRRAAPSWPQLNTPTYCSQGEA